MPSITHISCIYRIFCAQSGKSYVGSTEDSHKRFSAHRRILRKGKHHSVSLQRAWHKYGADAFTFEILEIIEPDGLLEREKFWFQQLDADNPNLSYNIASEPGVPMKNRQHSDERKQKWSEQRRGENNANYRGRMLVCPVCGKEFKAIGNSKTYCSPQCYHQAPKSAETRYKYGSATRGKRRQPLSLELAFIKRAKWYEAIDPLGNKTVFQGLARYCREHAIDLSSVCRVLSGQRKSHKGWVYRKIEPPL